MSFKQYLQEKLIIVNKRKRNGQIIFLAGGGGSGKSFALKKFIDTNDYKILNVDDIKDQFIKLGKSGNPRFSEYADLNTRNPNDVFSLHKTISDKGIASKKLSNLLNNVVPERLPNLRFDCTLRDMDYLKKVAEKLINTGYETKDIHIIWVLANYKIAVNQNKNRKRIVPDDILLDAHSGVAITMNTILNGDYPRNLFDGEIYVLLNDPETQIKIKKYYSDFAYIKAKDSGKEIKDDANIKMQLYIWIKQNIPMTKETKDLFE